MRLPRRWSLLQGRNVPSRVCLAERRPKPAADQQVPRWAWEQEDRLLAMPRWKRFVLMHVVPVCMALVWQLGMVLGFLVVLLLGLALLERLQP